MSGLGDWSSPVRDPTSVSGGVVLSYEVVTVNADGTVDLRNTASRASRQRVARITGWTPTVGDRVLVVDIGGDPQAPAIVSVQTAAAGLRVITAAAQSVIDLGPVAGETVTGVRVSLAGTIVGPGTNTFMRLRPNGLASISVGTVSQRTFWHGSGSGGDGPYGADHAAAAGLMVCATDWDVTTNWVTVDGVLFTRAGRNRHWQGRYTNNDAVTDPDRRLLGQLLSTWNDTTTAITSLALAIDSGTFTGRIVLESLP